MRHMPRLVLAVSLLLALTVHAAPQTDPAAALIACWGTGDDPAACEPLAQSLSSRPRELRERLLDDLVRAPEMPKRSLAVWLAIQTHSPFADPAVAEGLLAVDDARVLSQTLDYLQTFKVPVHASAVGELALKSFVPNVRAAAIRLLVDLDRAAALTAAREGLKSSSAAVQAASAGAVGRLTDAESVDTLVRLLSDPRFPLALRLEAAEALRRLGDPSVASLLYLHLRWPEPMLARKLVTAFGETAPPGLAPFLTDELTGDYGREVLVALARMKNLETTQALIGLFERPDMRDQTLHLLFWALGEMKDPAAVPSLLVQLRSADPDRATRAAEALGGIGARSAVRPLIEQLSNSDVRVTDMVAWALEKITGQTFEKDRTQWEAWLEQNPY